MEIVNRSEISVLKRTRGKWDELTKKLLLLPADQALKLPLKEKKEVGNLRSVLYKRVPKGKRVRVVVSEYGKFMYVFLNPKS